MNGTQRFSDEDLVAFLDGRAEPEAARAIERALATDADLAARLDGLHIDTAGIREAFDGLLPLAPAFEEKVEGLLPPAGGKRRLPMAVAATALMCLMAGAGAGWFAGTRQDEGWQSFAATYHSLYVNDTLASVHQPDAEIAADLARSSKALGREIGEGAIRRVAGLDFRRVQILGFGDQPLIQLAFLSNAGAPVALCITRAGPASQSGIEMKTLRGMSAASWIKGDYEYLLIGGHDDGLIERAAATFAESL